MDVPIKCKKCRIELFAAKPHYMLNGHGNVLSTNVKASELICATIQQTNELYLSEDNLPEWMFKEVERSQWTKGKLKCIGCDSRVGSFDFVCGTRCQCTKNVLPPVHLVKSKVDIPMNFINKF